MMLIWRFGISDRVSGRTGPDWIGSLLELDWVGPGLGLGVGQVGAGYASAWEWEYIGHWMHKIGLDWTGLDWTG